MVRSGSSRDRLHQLAAGAIHDELGLDATIGTVSVQLVPLTLIARDITLDDPVYGRFAEADELRIRPSFRALLRGAVDIDAIEVRGANLRLVIRNGQVRNLPRTNAPAGSGGPQLPFDELRVVDSTLTVDAEPDASGQLRQVDLSVHEDEGAIVVEAASEDGWVRHRGGRETLQHLEATVAIAPDQLRVPHLDLRTPVLNVVVDEAVAPIPFTDHGYAGDVDVSYDLAHLARLPLPPEVTLPPMSGRVRVEAHVTGEGREQAAHGTVTTDDVHIAEFGTGENGVIHFVADRQHVRILDESTLQLIHDGGRVVLSGSIGLESDGGLPGPGPRPPRRDELRAADGPARRDAELDRGVVLQRHARI